ncbi:peptidylprolyl isomerase [Acetobacterium bakii]|uniref:Peptidylprolyl isomerase n=1 Tax=Acetobacterium bakii TaxID=52689 RepID=A0A0L6U3X0_9FIRM|nr:SurA N-terminal domain-containing protein [Acetobacterium bakii]KNZ43211.1 peptidylprolyl isomerase [Acetobacterium bakii]
MKTKKLRTITLLLAVTILISFVGSGCSLVKVNPEADKKQVVAEINGEQILKESYNNYLAYYQMYYEASGMTFPTDVELKQLQLDLLDDLVRVETMAAQGKKDGVTVDEAVLTADAESIITSIKTTLGDEKYAAALAKNNTDTGSFETFMKAFVANNEYANTVAANYNSALLLDPAKELTTVVGTVGGDNVTKDVYNYRLSNEEFLAYYQNQEALATDDETMKTVNDNIFNTIAEQKAMTKYAEENNLTLAQEDVDGYITSQQAFVNSLLPGDETLQQYLDGKYLTVAQYREFEKQDAKATAAAAAIQADLASKAKVSDKEIKTYYDENKNSYDTSTVSAKHILATDETLAKQIYEEAKNAKTVEEFDAVMTKYQTVEGVSQATDLGAFTYATMVSAFSDAAFGMEKNTVSEPVKTDYGYHIIYVYDKNQAEIPALDTKKEEITEVLKNQKATEEFDKLKTKLTKKLTIKFDKILTPLETYMEQLKTDLNVEVFQNKI